MTHLLIFFKYLSLSFVYSLQNYGTRVCKHVGVAMDVLYRPIYGFICLMYVWNCYIEISFRVV